MDQRTLEGRWAAGRRWVAGGLVALAMAALAAAAMPGLAAAQTSEAPFTGEVPADGGVALLLATQDVAPAALGSALGAAGCDATSIALAEGGSWLVFIPGAPDFVNAAFPSTVSSGAGFAVLCAQGTGDGTGDGEATAEDAVGVLEAYFGLLDAGEYEAAYDLWRDGANGQTLAEFTEGYADTASVSAEIGEPGDIDPGAGQRYIPIPVVVTATLDDGTLQVFEGSIVLHRTADIPGATDEQRSWRIHSSDITQTN